MRKIFLIFLFLSALLIYSQEKTAFSLNDKIMKKLNIATNKEYPSLEQWLEMYQTPILIEVHRYLNQYNNNDYYFILITNNYRLTLLKSELSQKYYLYRVEINITEAEWINSLLPYKTIESYRNDNLFGLIINISEKRLLYEIVENWEYLTLEFENGVINKITISFPVE